MLHRCLHSVRKSSRLRSLFLQKLFLMKDSEVNLDTSRGHSFKRIYITQIGDIHGPPTFVICLYPSDMEITLYPGGTTTTLNPSVSSFTTEDAVAIGTIS